MSVTEAQTIDPRLERAIQFALPLLAPLAALPCATFQPDDLFIYLRMAGNVIAGGGWGFNPGAPINVASSPSWLLTLVASFRLLGSVNPLVPQVLSALLFALAIHGAMRLARQISGSTSAGWMAGLVLAGDAWSMRWCWSGMETGLAIAAPLWSLVWLTDPAPTGRSRWCGAAALVLAALTRPELVVLLLLAALWLAVDRERPMLLRLLPLALIVGLAWGLFSYITWGDLIPASVRAKGSLGEQNISVVGAAGRSFLALAGTQPVFVAAAVWFGLRKAFSTERTAERLAARITLTFPLLVTLLYAVRHVKIYSRYAMPATALMVTLGTGLLSRALAGRGVRAARAWSGLALAVTLLGNGAIAAHTIVPQTRAYAASMQSAVRPIAERLLRHCGPGETIATHNIGMLGFISGLPILDLNGLATPEILPFKREGRESSFLASHPPAWIVFVDPNPDPLGKEIGGLLLQREDVAIFRGMFVTGPDPTYLTVYRVLGAGR